MKNVALTRPQRSRWARRRLRILLSMLIGCAGLYVCVAQLVGYGKGLAVIVVEAIAIGAICCGWQKRYLALRFLGAIVGVGLLWFLAIDFLVFLERCHYCDSYASLVQYRAFGCVLSEERPKEYQSLKSRIADALGAPCPHYNERWKKLHAWGLVYYSWDSECMLGEGGWLLSDDVEYEWSDEDAVRVLQAKARQRPELQEEFYRKVLVQLDNEYYARFVHELRESRNRVLEERATGG